MVLESSKALTLLLEPSVAALVQSESRLLSRGVLQLNQELALKMGRLEVRPSFMKAQCLCLGAHSCQVHTHTHTLTHFILLPLESRLKFHAADPNPVDPEWSDICSVCSYFCRMTWSSCRTSLQSWTLWTGTWRCGSRVWRWQPSLRGGIR